MSVQQLSGKRFGGCILAEEIGRGGMGVVYKAKQLEPMRDAVIKVISSEYVQPGSVASFKKEIHLLSNLHHPNILPVYTAGTQNGMPYVVMQYVDGGDVAKLMMRNGGPLDVAQAVQITNEVASALTSAHELGFVHRDVKPGNVLIARHPFRALLADFGLATVVGEQGMSNFGAGTPGFWAPEQWQGGALDARTDVYALAATLYSMLAARPPDVAYPTANGSKAIAVRDMGPAVPRTTAEAIQRGLSPDPEERHSSAKEFAADASRDVEIPAAVWLALAGLAVTGAATISHKAYVGFKEWRAKRKAARDEQEAGDVIVDAEVVTDLPAAGPVVCTHCGRVPRDPARETCSQCGRPLHRMDGKVPVSALDE